MSERNFYHSFPRPRKGDTEGSTLARGLSILREISTTGLILSPEIIRWKMPMVDGSDRMIELLQTRTCFTELSPDELPKYAQKFGPISLEFDVATLRRLGALPVIYMPQSADGEKDFSPAGALVVSYITYIKHAIGRLYDLNVIADDKLFLQEALKQGHHDAKSIAEDCMVTLTNTSKQNAPVREFVVSRKTIACMVSYIGFENAPLDQMLNVLSLVQSLFYPTDDERHDESLAYYRQREWRIVDGFVSKGSPLTRPLVDAEKKRLIEIDQQFWNGTICYSNNKKRRVDIDRAVNGLEKRPMTDLISKVWVPKTAHDTAARLFGDKVAVI